MREFRLGWTRRSALLGLVAVACFAVLAFSTLAKTIQYWPELNAKLQVSNSCKLEIRQTEGIDRDPLATEAFTLLTIVREHRLWGAPADVASLPMVPFEPSVF